MTQIQVVMPVAGKGTRMRPMTLTKAKPLLPIAGKPALEHIIDRISTLDVSEYLFVTGYLGDQMKDYIGARGLPAQFFEQKEQRGPADAINAVRDAVNKPMLIEFVDTIFETDLSVINDSTDDGIIWAKEVEDYQRFGIIIEKDGYMTDIVEKPSEPIGKLANIGLYYIRNYELFFKGIDHMYEKNLTVKGEYFLPEAFRYMLKNGAKIKVLPVGEWLDTGEPKTTLESNAYLLKTEGKVLGNIQGASIIEPVYIGEGSSVYGGSIGPNVSIGPGCSITNSNVENSIIDAGCTLKNVGITSSILGERVAMHGLKLNNALVDNENRK